MKEITGRQREELTVISKDALEARKRPFLSASPLVLGALTLGACGGGSGGGSAPGPAPTPAPPPAPGPDFIEDPDGVFTARDGAGRTLDEGGATGDLIVFGGEGADTITTGSGIDVIRGAGGDDVIDAGAGNDLILGGAGADNVTAGDGDDVIVVVGTSAVDQYTTDSIVNPGGSGLDLSSLLDLSDINGVTDSHVVAGEVLDGGAGTNTLVVFGDVDLTEATILNVTQLQVNSDVILTTDQLAQFTLVDGDGGSTLRIVASDGAPVVVDLNSFDLMDVNRLDLGPNVTVSVDSAEALRDMGVTVVTGEGQLVLTGADADLAGLILGNDIDVQDSDGLDVDASEAGATRASDARVDDVDGFANQVPTSISLSSASVDENVFGAVIGEFIIADPDVGDVHAFIVDDERFQVIDGVLQLKPDVALDFEEVSGIPLLVTVTDSAGNSFTEELNVDVLNVPEFLEAVSAELSIRVLDEEKVAFDLSNAFSTDAEVTYVLEGADAHLFHVLPNGVLSFINAPDVDLPIDADENGVYSVSVTAVSDELGISDDVLFNIEIDPRLTAVSVESSPIDDGPFIDALIHPGQNAENSAFIWGGGPADAPLILTWSIATVNSAFSDVHLSFDVIERLDGILPTADEIQIIQDALDLWGESTNVQFVYVDEVADPTESGAIRFFFFSQGPTGVGFLPGTEDLGGNIFIRDNLRAGLSESGPNFSKLILNHEIAHGVFGLQDVTPLAGLNDERLPWQFNHLGWTSLSYLNAGLGTVVDGSTDYISPQILDILLAQHLHGVDTTHNVDDTVYEVNQETGRAYWDAGGNDTLDASDTDGAARIDLRDGHLSTLGETGYVGIAFNAVIENAVGTDFDDIFFLNDAANIIEAGLGDDIIRAAFVGDVIDGGDGFDQVDILGNIDDYTIIEQEDGSLLLSGIDGDITLTGVELVTFFDARVNFSDVDETIEAPSSEGTTYISVNTETFDTDLWGYDATEALAYIPILPTLAGQTTEAPVIDLASGLFVDGSGGVRFGGDPAVAGNYAIDYGQPGVPAQNVELELTVTDNVYTIDIATATAQVDIWDFDGQDRLVLDFGMNAIGSLDAFADQDNLYITVVDSLGNGVNIVVHNYQWYGFIEEIAFRSVDGEQVFNTAPFAEATRIGREQAAFGIESDEFPVDANYFFAGQNDGEGLYNADAEFFSPFTLIDETVLLGAGNDLVFLGEGSNLVETRAGDDVIHSGDSGDEIRAGRGDDIIYAGGGNDIIFAAFETSDLQGQHVDNDIVYAGDGDDFVRAEDGDDLIYLGAGDDTTDSSFDQGNDTTFGEAGNDLIRSGAGDDFADGGDGDDDVFGDDFAVQEGFTPGNDELHGGAGNDRVSGDGGNDMVFGGDGNDRLFGDRNDGTEPEFDGDDVLDGGTGADMLFGGGGDDILIARASDLVEDRFEGGGGHDILQIVGDSGHDIDLTAIRNDARIFEIEEISLDNGGADTLSLTANDILSISDTDTLTITGEDGDIVDLGQGQWVDGGEQVIDGETFQVFTSGDATLLVDPDILVNVPVV